MIGICTGSIFAFPERSTVNRPTTEESIPMLIFTCFGVLALVISLLLKREDRIKGYGLELPNIKKDADIVLAEEMIGEGQR